MIEFDATFSSGLQFSGVPKSAVLASAGSAKQGCAVQFGVSPDGSQLTLGFHAFASPEIVAVCDWVCRHWDAGGKWSAIDLPTLQQATGLNRSWAADLLVVVEASDKLGKALAGMA
ncbi:MAG: hypothetical protein AAF578_11405 [Pseudomonadota bacterium]